MTLQIIFKINQNEVNILMLSMFWTKTNFNFKEIFLNKNIFKKKKVIREVKKVVLNTSYKYTIASVFHVFLTQSSIFLFFLFAFPRW